MNRNVTIVTGLWDLKRGDIEGWGKRDFQQYKDHFFDLLKTDAQMCIFIHKEIEKELNLNEYYESSGNFLSSKSKILERYMNLKQDFNNQKRDDKSDITLTEDFKEPLNILKKV
jgi:hypothetical protein